MIRLFSAKSSLRPTPENVYAEGMGSHQGEECCGRSCEEGRGISLIEFSVTGSRCRVSFTLTSLYIPNLCLVNVFFWCFVKKRVSKPRTIVLLLLLHDLDLLLRHWCHFKLFLTSKSRSNLPLGDWNLAPEEGLGPVPRVHLAPRENATET